MPYSKATRTALASLPATLEEPYDQVISCIEEEALEDAEKVLS